MYGIYSDHPHLEHKLCAKYHDSSSTGYPDILFTMSFMAKMPKSEKGQIFTKFYKKLTSVFCIIYPNSTHDIMILAQAALQIFCWQHSIGLQCISKPEDHWSCIAHLSAEDMLQTAVNEEKKFKNIESEWSGPRSMNDTFGTHKALCTWHFSWLHLPTLYHRLQ